ncbi:NAD binding domain of 6-phosphogluconate dehydrogenase family protein [Bordetella holmesii 35009]|nr:NAD binding domain of 6-phosphogluconate dehydrogenase family protein [Bordetella holmesii 35009]
MSAPRVGFIGVGSMGWPMAHQLHQAGFPLTVFDAAPGQAGRFAAEVGGQAAADCQTLARQSDIIVTMLPTSAIVEQVLSGADGVLAGLQPGTIIVEMSSGVPAHTQRLAALVGAAGGELVDAPVSGACRAPARVSWPSCSVARPLPSSACARCCRRWVAPSCTRVRSAVPTR